MHDYWCIYVHVFSSVLCCLLLVPFPIYFLNHKQFRLISPSANVHWHFPSCLLSNLFYFTFLLPSLLNKWSLFKLLLDIFTKTLATALVPSHSLQISQQNLPIILRTRVLPPSVNCFRKCKLDWRWVFWLRSPCTGHCCQISHQSPRGGHAVIQACRCWSCSEM